MYIEKDKIKNEFITLKGIDLFCPAVIDKLDDFRITFSSPWVQQNYNKLICGIEMAVIDWCQDECYTLEWITRYGYSEPKSSNVPETIAEMFEQLFAVTINIYDDFIEKCKKTSDRMYNAYLKEKGKEVQKCNKVADLATTCLKDDRSPILIDVEFLYMLENAKKNDKEYKMIENEIIATRLLARILLLSLESPNITFGIIFSLIKERFVDESDLTKLLKNKYKDERDWEWYSDGSTINDLEDKTIFTIDDILNIGLEKILNTIGIDRSYLHLDVKK